jgi:hypothetical protein
MDCLYRLCDYRCVGFLDGDYSRLLQSETFLIEHYSDCVWKLITGVQEDWSRRANFIFPIWQQECSLRAEEAMVRRAESSEEKTLGLLIIAAFSNVLLDPVLDMAAIGSLIRITNTIIITVIRRLHMIQRS